jgi:DNA mismatch repair protein MutS
VTVAVATPLMQQYREIKGRHQDAILFFRMGEFYEMFYGDAEIASRVLGLTLTSRNNGGAAEVPLAGIPVKAAGDYVRRLVTQGFRVAICEQIEDPRLAKGIVKRAVVETITPGSALSDDLLDGTRNNYIVALGSHHERSEGSAVRSHHERSEGSAFGGSIGVAAVDVSTGEFRLATVRSDELEALFARLSPREVVVMPGDQPVPAPVPGGEGPLVTEREPWEFDSGLATDELIRHFNVSSLDGFGIESTDSSAIGAAGALLRYLRELQPAGLPQLGRPIIERPGGTMPLDEMTRRNLELCESLRGGNEGTLLSVLDRTSTSMGARMLRQWLLSPLVNRVDIDARLDAVGALFDRATARQALRDAFAGVRDIERLAAKAASGRSTPRELRALGDSLSRLPAAKTAVDLMPASGRLGVISRDWDHCADIAASIRSTLVVDAPITFGDEPAIAAGVDAELDSLRELRDGGKDLIARIQADERDRTGINSLKVGFNKISGYYIEVTKSNLHLVPADYQRRQTITNGERYVTPALKEYETRVLTAAERIETRERELFDTLRNTVAEQITRLQRAARALGELDVLATFAEVAARESYVRPTLDDGFDIEILGGRHPVVERMMPRDKFIPNDVRLTSSERVIILTGPNMAGKSTILRQIGLIVLMAQIGAYVPARSAKIGIADRVFTRVGASDNLVRGQSTFMVEMAETSAILHMATDRSLVLLDEIGRGTSTYDGVSIAWSVTEHIHDKIGAKTVFATHYHELTQLADELSALRNFNVGVREVGDEILFLHRLMPGGADRSYGIEVGRLAGLPRSVIDRAKAVLQLLESEQLATGLAGRSTAGSVAVDQLALFVPAPHPVIERLQALDIETMTPLAALTLLAELAKETRRSS